MKITQLSKEYVCDHIISEITSREEAITICNVIDHDVSFISDESNIMLAISSNNKVMIHIIDKNVMFVRSVNDSSDMFALADLFEESRINSEETNYINLNESNIDLLYDVLYTIYEDLEKYEDVFEELEVNLNINHIYKKYKNYDI